MRGDGAGRRPKPTALHHIHGTARARTLKARKAEPMPVGDLTAAPSWMDEAQREGWNYAIEHSPPGLLKLLDRGILALWVEAENRHRIASMTQSALNRRDNAPYLVKGPDGLMMSPYVEIMDRAAKIMFRAADHLGFSPVARPRIKVQPAPGEASAEAVADPWATLRVIPGGKSR